MRKLTAADYWANNSRVTGLEEAPWEALARLSVLGEALSVMTGTLPLHSKRLKATFKPPQDGRVSFHST